jgi:hypothetical protein
MATIPRVALLIETSREYGREVLRGVMRYARLHGPWAFHITPGDFMQAVPKIKHWGGTRIIARIETSAVGKALLATKLPIVAMDLDCAQLKSDSLLSRCSELSSDSSHAGCAARDRRERKPAGRQALPVLRLGDRNACPTDSIFLRLSAAALRLSAPGPCAFPRIRSS